VASNEEDIAGWEKEVEERMQRRGRRKDKGKTDGEI
jgi:hypothetical protein